MNAPFPKQTIAFTLNGKKLSVEAEPRMLVSDLLRHVVGATGTHVGCEHGVCGCCTIMIDGVAGRSCLAFAAQIDGADIRTVESLSVNGELNHLQECFRKHHALQCGFCTSGILMSLTDFLSRHADPSREDIVDVVGGHICRCTGYANIINAVMDFVAWRHQQQKAQSS
jgi:2-furoyl-CoA dehydrogenase 2Fe-2S iron sulfur subunit